MPPCPQVKFTKKMEVVIMDKKKLKLMLGWLGLCLVVAAIIVAVITGQKELVRWEGFDLVDAGHKFDIDYVQFQYVVPLLIGGIISFIISSCITTKSTKTDDE